MILRSASKLPSETQFWRFKSGLVSLILVFVAIGIPMLVILAILHIAFPIIAAVKAHEGKMWSYPLTIRFFPEH